VGLTRALVVINPVAGGGRAPRAWARARATLADLQAGLECATTEAPGHARRLALDAARRGVERVVAVGGDGTVSEVAGGLIGTDVALGVVPAGTGNDYGRALGLPRQPARAARLALEGAAQRIDLGHVQLSDGRASFVNVAGCGLDAEVVRRTRPGHGLGPGGALTYLAGVVRSLRAFRPRPLCFERDGQRFERRALSVAVALGPRYGGGMRIAPGAVMDDGLFDVCLVGDLSPRQVLALLPRLYAGTHARHPAVELFRCRELRVQPSGPAGGVSCQADGELLGELPAVFTIQPGGLRCVTGHRP
jgi:diacylglycerol kinase (ATP)